MPGVEHFKTHWAILTPKQVWQFLNTGTVEIGVDGPRVLLTDFGERAPNLFLVTIWHVCRKIGPFCPVVGLP